MEKEISREVEEKLKKEIEKLKEIEFNLQEYRDSFSDLGHGWESLEAFIEYIQFFRPKDIHQFLSELSENAKNERLKHEKSRRICRVHEELDHIYYKKRTEREHLLKNFHETFGAIEKPISDAENEVKNCDSFPDLFFDLYIITFFDREKVYKRKLTKSEFDKIMEKACSFDGLRKLTKNYEGDKKASSMFETYEEWKNTPYQDTNK